MAKGSKRSERPAQFAIGIDLGTTNSVIAYTDLRREDRAIELLPVPQILAASTVETRLALPSFLYLPPAGETAKGAFALPWRKESDAVAGEYARRQAAEIPTRVVAAAKSWLAHTRVDRRQSILPWNAPDDVEKISPVAASQKYLEHLVSAWNAAFPEAPFAEQLIVLTVPASFDASARELTREAALAAEFPEDFVLLEEPQAALYAWLADAGDAWRRQLKVGDVLLVCDVGGGTTDFTLIGVEDQDGVLGLKRIAVGNHILVGGDNMDLALAHFATQAFGEKGVTIDPWQSVALWHSCRTAKETLLGSDGPKKHPVAVLGRGSRLVGGTISVELDRKEVSNLLVEGFFPLCRIDEKPARRRASGFQELGLPFETDTAITRHLAQFLTLQGGQGEKPIRPTHLLFNGGVLKAAALRERLISVLGSWFDQIPKVLEGKMDLDFAVARGAAYYGAAKQGHGVRIRGGTARAYYVGIETAGLAVPGAPRPLRLLCVVPFGMEEGTETQVPSDEIGLIVGEPAQFRFFSSPVRKQDRPGSIIDRWNENEVAETDSMQATLPRSEEFKDEIAPIRFESRITELGVLELWCKSAISDDRWKLEFSVRPDGA